MSAGLPLHRLAWLAALLPFLTTHLSYLLAASLGQVEWCVPYWDGCTSISATGRQLPTKLWFKLGMIPGALCAWALWLAAAAWAQRADAPTQYPRSLRAMPWLGGLAALFLILYTLALGEEGVAYQTLRRSGVILAFSFTFLAQLLFTRLLGERAQRDGDAHLLAWQRRLLALLVLLLSIGVLSVLLDLSLGERYDLMEDSFEWTLALGLHAWFAGLALAWRHQPYRVGLVRGA